MKNLTPNQKKFFGLVAALGIVALFSYKLSISKALGEYSNYRELTERRTAIAGLDGKLLKWNRLNEEIDLRLGNEGNGNFQENLLMEAGLFCHTNKLTLSNFSEPLEGEEGSYIIETVVLRVEGPYSPLLRLLHHLEHNFREGRIASVNFLKKENYRQKKEELFMEVHVQKVKKKSDEQI